MGRRMKPPMPGGKDMLRQLRKLQEELLKAQERLEEETVVATAGGGVVKVVMDGRQRVRSITIAPEVVDPEDVEMLQDLIVAAVNEASQKAQELAASRLGALTEGLGLPFP